MPMTYTSLIAGKTTAGSIAKWVNYTLLDAETIVDEAQALIYMALRCREQRTATQFTMLQGMSYIALPARFLDPIGRIRLLQTSSPVRHTDQGFLDATRTYTEEAGVLAASPFSVTSGSTEATVTLTAHGFSQGSSFYTTGASAVGGVTITGTFEITSVATNTFTIDISSVGTPSSTTSGGGSSVVYTCDNLTQGFPEWFSITNERIYFDCAFAETTVCRLNYYQSLPLLSSSNTTNFLTNRYPHVLREACMASAADFMKDSAEYQKHLTALAGKVQRAQQENDMEMRGMEVDSYTP